MNLDKVTGLSYRIKLIDPFTINSSKSLFYSSYFNSRFIWSLYL